MYLLFNLLITFERWAPKTNLGFLGSLILNDQTCPDSVDTKNYYFFAKIE
jgi:hypothetical protein